MRFGRPLPERIQNAPELCLGNLLFYQGFLELTSSRQIGKVLGPIPVLKMLEYCELVDIDGELRTDFIWIVTRLDQKYLEWSKASGKS